MSRTSCRPADGESCARPLGGTGDGVCAAVLTPASTQPFLILTAVSAGKSGVNVKTAVPVTVSGSTSFRLVRKQNSAFINFHALFLNWLAFVPSDLRANVHVLALDNSSAALATAHGVAAAHVRPPCCRGAPWCANLTLGWGYRIHAIRHFLSRGEAVLVSDLDAIWLRDPRPFLRAFLLANATSALDIVGMRGKHHQINNGFVLYQPSFLAGCDAWVEHWLTVTHQEAHTVPSAFRTLSPLRLYTLLTLSCARCVLQVTQHDQASLIRLYGGSDTTWQDDEGSGLSLGVHRVAWNASLRLSRLGWSQSLGVR